MAARKLEQRWPAGLGNGWDPRPRRRLWSSQVGDYGGSRARPACTTGHSQVTVEADAWRSRGHLPGQARAKGGEDRFAPRCWVSHHPQGCARYMGHENLVWAHQAPHDNANKWDGLLPAVWHAVAYNSGRSVARSPSSPASCTSESSKWLKARQIVNPQALNNIFRHSYRPTEKWRRPLKVMRYHRPPFKVLHICDARQNHGLCRRNKTKAKCTKTKIKTANLDLLNLTVLGWQTKKEMLSDAIPVALWSPCLTTLIRARIIKNVYLYTLQCIVV